MNRRSTKWSFDLTHTTIGQSCDLKYKYGAVLRIIKHWYYNIITFMLKINHVVFPVMFKWKCLNFTFICLILTSPNLLVIRYWSTKSIKPYSAYISISHWCSVSNDQNVLAHWPYSDVWESEIWHMSGK